jgi:hypothetical protein
MRVRSLVSFCAVFSLLVVGSTAANAQCKHGGSCETGFFEQFAADFAERNAWPYPYVCPDREAVRAPFAIMVQNGWRRQNMLTDAHFKDQGAELTDAGKLKIQWILTGVPSPHRTIFVHRADTPELTEARIRSVQQLASKGSPDGSVPAVLESTVSPAGWPADKADAVSRKFHTALPLPQLPKDQGGEGGSSSN